MNFREIHDRFISFFESRGHTTINSASVVPENDPSSLFTTAGMQPLVPYLLGQDHPAGRRLVNVQKCVRTNDIDEVGDATHLTFFQMLGNWALGDLKLGGYGKEEAIKWSYEFLTNSESGLGLDPNRLYITVFSGNDDAPRDTEAALIWQSVGIPENKIYYLGADSNWWSPGDNGPCGPNSEMFYDLTESGLGNLTHDQFLEADENQHVVEIWNDVFMEYEKRDGVVVGKLSQTNIDTGAGLERLAVVLQEKDTVYQTDLFKNVVTILEDESKSFNKASAYIIADHVRTALIMISDGVVPSNTDQGYILRRLIRRSMVQAHKLGINNTKRVFQEVVNNYSTQLGEIYTLNQSSATEIINDEIVRFEQTLEKGIREFNKIEGDIGGADAFILFSTYGFPLELIKELAAEKGMQVDEKGFNDKFSEHQKASKAGSDKKFKGGLAGDDEMSVKYHTATHLLHAALREILGDHVEQRGSNITPDRLRFDFSHPDKLTDDEKRLIEEWVNDKITQSLDVNQKMMNKQDAIDSGAIALFADKYSDEVSVYTIGDDNDFVSRELCGGPHVKNTAELGRFKIKKEEASSAGVRRIKAILE